MKKHKAIKHHMERSQHHAGKAHQHAEKAKDLMDSMKHEASEKKLINKLAKMHKKKKGK